MTVQDITQKAINNNALIIFAPPDHIFGHGLIKLIDDIQPGEYYVCGHPRISYQNSINNLDLILNSISDDFDNKNLVKIGMKNFPHSVVINGLKNMKINHFGGEQN